MTAITKRFVARHGIDNNNNTLINVNNPVDDGDAVPLRFYRDIGNIDQGVLNDSQLPDVNPAPGIYSADGLHVPQFTVDSKGRITNAQDIPIEWNNPLNYGFNSIVVSGQPIVTATSNTSSFRFVAGLNMVITTNNTTKEIFFSSLGGGGGGGEELAILPAGETLAAGELVYINNNGEVMRAAANIAPAVGFTKIPAVAGNPVGVYRGLNELLSGLIPGQRCYLGLNPGSVTQVPISAAGQIHQFVGVAFSSTSFLFEDEEHILLS